MPELPDITIYLEALEKRILNHTLERVQIASPFLLRTAAPPISSIEGKRIVKLRRLGKRICVGVQGDLWIVLHLMTHKMTAEEVKRLYHATRDTLVQWVERLRAETGDAFPEKVTAFRKDMAVHGRYREPCPRCGTKVQRIRYATNETNYCPKCQTDGKLLADRALSRLLREDWPKTADELG